MTLLGCSEEKASLLADGGPIKPAVDAGTSPPTARSPLDGGLDGGRRDASRDPEDGEDEAEDETTDDTEDESERDGGGSEGDGRKMTVSIPAVESGVLAADFRCDEDQRGGISPEISWTPGPEGTKSYAVTLRALDMQLAANWTIFDIPADVTTLPEGIPVGAQIEQPVPARQARNSQRPAALGYRGPCGLEAQYELTVYALDVETLPDLDAEPYPADVEAAIAEHGIGGASASETFSSAP